MVLKFLPPWLKGWKLSLTIGLLILLSVIAWRTRFLTRTRVSLLTKWIALDRKYKALWPYIVAQCKFETDSFTSAAYLNEHNMLGMGIATSGRYQPGKPSTRKYDGGRTLRSYRFDFDSIRDLMSYFDKVGFPTSVTNAKDYADELGKRGYYKIPASDYAKGLELYL